MLDRAVEHLGAERAASYLKKFHPWYVERLGAGKETQNPCKGATSVDEQRDADRGACAGAILVGRLKAPTRRLAGFSFSTV